MSKILRLAACAALFALLEMPLVSHAQCGIVGGRNFNNTGRSLVGLNRLSRGFPAQFARSQSIAIQAQRANAARVAALRFSLLRQQQAALLQRQLAQRQAILLRAAALNNAGNQTAVRRGFGAVPFR